MGNSTLLLSIRLSSKPLTSNVQVLILQLYGSHEVFVEGFPTTTGLYFYLKYPLLIYCLELHSHPVRPWWEQRSHSIFSKLFFLTLHIMHLILKSTANWDFPKPLISTEGVFFFFFIPPVNLVNLWMFQEYLLSGPWISLSGRSRSCSYQLAGQQLGRLTIIMESPQLRFMLITIGFWLLTLSAGAPVVRCAARG